LSQLSNQNYFKQKLQWLRGGEQRYLTAYDLFFMLFSSFV